MHLHTHAPHHTHTVHPRTIRLLIVSFVINMLLTGIELGFGWYADSVALVGDALHNAGDAFAILIAVIAFYIGSKKATERFSYGFKRAETIGSFVNLILLFLAGIYLIYEGIEKIVFPDEINGPIIIIVSILALIIDIATAKLTHGAGHQNTNMRLVFLHNLSDAFGSAGVIISGICVTLFGWTCVDGLIAFLIGVYMIAQSVLTFKPIVGILMNETPAHLSLHEIKTCIQQVPGVKDVHHIHVWSVDETQTALECHVIGSGPDLITAVHQIIETHFGIHHITIQQEQQNTVCPDSECPL